LHAHEIIRKKEENVLQVIPFNSGRKRACTAVRHPDLPNTIRVFVKGAPEIVMEYCQYYFDKDGNRCELTNSKKEYILHEIVTNTFAKKAYRTILIAYTDVTTSQYESMKSQSNDFATERDREVLETDLNIIGIFAL
jgi:Ca2+ transporting ATPase